MTLRSARYLVSALLATLTGLTPAAWSAVPAPASVLVLDGVTVVDTRTGGLTPGRALVVEGGRIAAILPAGAARLRGAQIVHARGEFVVPGFNDMHAHPLNDEGVERDDELAMMLANGITGVRQMSGTNRLLNARRLGRLRLPTDSPALLAMPGEILTRQNAETPQAAVAEVDRQKAEGADFIKVIDVSPETFFAVGREATRLGLPFLGHLPNGIDPLDASRAGFRSIEHLGPSANILIGCSTDEEAIKRDIARRPSPSLPAWTKSVSLEDQKKLGDLVATAPLVRAIETGPGALKLMDRVAATYDDVKCRQIAQTFVRNGTWQSPTLIRDKTILFPDDPRSVNDPDLRYVDAQRRALWLSLARRFAETSPSDRAILERFWRTQLKMLHVFDETGVAMISGTDTPGQWDVAGVALHRDFDLLQDDGLSPLKILQMTTLNPAIFLGRQSTMGTVEVGRNADLVLLEGDPTRSTQNLHRIQGVVRAGRYYAKADLARLQDEVARRASEVTR